VRKEVHSLTSLKLAILSLLVFFLSMVTRRKVKGPSTRFLIPGYTGLGNFILKTPMISALRERLPDAKIDILCGNAFGTEFVLKDSNLVSQIIVHPMNLGFFSTLRFYWGIRNSYDAIFLFFDTAHVKWLYLGSLIARIPIRIGHTFGSSVPPTTWQAKILTRSVPIVSGSHEIDCNFDLLAEIFPNVRRTYPPTCQSGSLENLRAKFSKWPWEEAFVLVQTGAANGTITPKIWTVEGFRNLIFQLAAKGERVILTGDHNEVERTNQIIGSSYSDLILNLVGKTAVEEVSALVKQAKAIVCHDSGIMHIASAHDKPVIVVAGPTDMSKNRPRHDKVRIVSRYKECSPCIRFGGPWSESEAPRLCPSKVDCMTGISASEVMAALDDLVGERSLQS
jgi:ADP-heptose:LPS heptosyltransferase